MRYAFILLSLVILCSCGGITKILKNPDPTYKLRIAEQYFVKKKYLKAQQLNKDANEIIDICRRKLEIKDFKSALLYYDLGQYRAAGVAFTSLLDSYPDSEKVDEYMYMIIKSYYRFAELSIDEKKAERFEQVI